MVIPIKLRRGESIKANKGGAVRLVYIKYFRGVFIIVRMEDQSRVEFVEQNMGSVFQRQLDLLIYIYIYIENFCTQ